MMRSIGFWSILFLSQFALGQNRLEILTNDGAWCWFSDPRALIKDSILVTGWVKSNGTVEAVSMNLRDKSTKVFELYFQLEKDDHDNPAFYITEKEEFVAMFTRHSKKDLFIFRLPVENDSAQPSGAQLIHPLSRKELENFPVEHVTYANPWRLTDEQNRVYCFGRYTGYKPNLMWSDDAGINWTKSKVFITNHPFDANNRPYAKYFSDGVSKIHCVFTNGHPRNEPHNSVYYAFYQNGHFFKVNGDTICNLFGLPFEPKDASMVFEANFNDGRAWIADIGQDKKGNPIILFTKSPTDLNHEYWYASFIDNDWKIRKICDSGKWFPQTKAGETEREPHYFGGMSIHPSNSGVVFLSRQVNGVFEIERWETQNEGDSWKSYAITSNSALDNVRPYVPRGLSSDSEEIVLWMENKKYLHYTDFRSSIKFTTYRSSK